MKGITTNRLKMYLNQSTHGGNKRPSIFKIAQKITSDRFRVIKVYFCHMSDTDYFQNNEFFSVFFFAENFIFQSLKYNTLCFYSVILRFYRKISCFLVDKICVYDYLGHAFESRALTVFYLYINFRIFLSNSEEQIDAARLVFCSPFYRVKFKLSTILEIRLL